MLVIGIESSAHTFGAGICEGGKILANEKEMYHISTSGMIPGRVAETHIRNAALVIGRAMSKANVKFSDLEGVGYTMGPGMGPCLQVGALSARTIARRLGIKIAAVNHCVAHAEITRNMAHMSDPIVVYVSGGNSQLLRLQGSPRRYHVIGETLDIGIGNMLDTFARGIGLDPAWGSTVEKKAMSGSYVELPYTVKGMDFSFTGLLTKALELANTESSEDLCYSIQETSFSMLCEAAERAMLLSGKDEVCVSGGVAQNTRLREMLRKMAEGHGSRFAAAPNEFNADNGGMIAFVAERMLEKGYYTPIENCTVKQRYRVNTAVVP